jgi:putative membrane-bound dehydrogenase-like protein
MVGSLVFDQRPSSWMKALLAVALSSLLMPAALCARAPDPEISNGFRAEFDLQLVAAGNWNPTAVDWDPRGRMWVTVSRQSLLQPRRLIHTDSILVLDASRTGTFCHGLNRIGGLLFHGNDVVVAEGSRIVLLRDMDRDGRADQREVIFSGFGTEWQPAWLGSFRQGFDGWVYAVLGRGGERCNEITGKGWSGQIRAGIIRFKCDGTAMETVSSFASESGALDFTRDNELFFSRAEGPHVAHVGMAERYFPVPGLTNASSHRKIEDHQTVLLRQHDESHRVAVPLTDRSFKYIAGATIYDGGAWPERYQGNFYVCDPLLRVIHEDVISRAESPYFEATRRLNGEFLIAETPSFCPRELRIGPDGAMYVLVGREEPFSGYGPRWQSQTQASSGQRGAIWRIQHKQARHFAAPNLVSPTSHELAHSLEHPNGWVRRTAARLLTEHSDREAIMLLEEIVRSSRSAPARVSALWCLHRLNALTHTTWTNALEDAHFGIQRNAWLVFAESSRAVTPEIEKIFNREYKDADERVKPAMLLALSKGPLTPGMRETVAKLFPDLKDVWSRSAVLAIAQQTPLDFIKVAFASDKSENFRELVVPLVEELATEKRGLSDLAELTRKHAEKTQKLTAAVREALARTQR